MIHTNCQTQETGSRQSNKHSNDSYRVSDAGDWFTSVFSTAVTDDDRLTLLAFDVDAASDERDTITAESLVNDSLLRRSSSSRW